MNVEELRIFIEAIANKDQSGDSMSPEEYNAFLARSTEALFRREYRLYDTSQVITDALKPFVTKPTAVALVSGYGSLPSDYVHELSLTYTVSGKKKVVTVLSEDDFAYIETHPTAPPTTDYPKAVFRDNQVYVAPDTIASVDMVYLKLPTTPVWAYTINSADVAVYDSANSVQLPWDKIYHLDVAKIILSYMGIEFRDDELKAYAKELNIDA